VDPLGGPESEFKKRYPERPNVKCVIAMVLKFKNLDQAVSGPPRGIDWWERELFTHFLIFTALILSINQKSDSTYASALLGYIKISLDHSIA
jgi:hypothetical protein